MRRLALFVLAGALVSGACKESRSGGNANVASSNTNANTSPVKVPGPIKPETSPDPSFKPCNVYMPLVPGSVAKYILNYSSGAAANVTVVVDAAEENGRRIFVKRTQTIDTTGGNQLIQLTVQKLACNGEVIEVLSETNDTVLNPGGESRSEFKFRPNSVLMPDIASLERKGTTWTHAFTQNMFQKDKPPSIGEQPIIVKFSVEGPDTVNIGLGEFNVVKVVRKVNAAQITEYYCRGLGMVRRQAAEGTSWELKEYSGLKALD